MQTEVECRPIPGWEGYYEASVDGRIWSVERLVPVRREGWSPRRIHSREMRQHRINGGRLRVTLTKDNSVTGRGWFVHRLVLMAFCPRDDMASLQVNHKDGNPSNNRLENLEWCTCSENHLHAWSVLKREHGMKKFVGAKNVNSMAVEALDPETGEVVKRYESMGMAEIDGHINQSISKVINGKMRVHHGLLWRRAS